MACALSYSWQSPLATPEGLCDAERACWFGPIDSYHDCVEQAGIDREESCDCTAAPFTGGFDCFVPCDDALGDSSDGCLGDCQSTFDSAVAACEALFPPGSDQDACIATAATDKDACDTPCFSTWVTCRYECFVSVQRDAVAASYEDPNCFAACCSTETDNIHVCNGHCDTTQALAVLAAGLAFWDCMAGLTVFFYDGSDSPTINSFGVASAPCSNAQALANQAAENADNICRYDCETDFDRRWGVCTDNRLCARACTKKQADDLLGCQADFDDSPDEGAFAECEDTANATGLRCRLSCCLNQKGGNSYDRPFTECIINYGSCTTALTIDCPDPGTGPGDPCQVPDSDECVEAQAEESACRAPLLEECEKEYTDCVGAIEADPPGCAGCTPPGIVFP